LHASAVSLARRPALCTTLEQVVSRVPLSSHGSFLSHADAPWQGL